MSTCNSTRAYAPTNTRLHTCPHSYTTHTQILRHPDTLSRREKAPHALLSSVTLKPTRKDALGSQLLHDSVLLPRTKCTRPDGRLHSAIHLLCSTHMPPTLKKKKHSLGDKALTAQNEISVVCVCVCARVCNSHIHPQETARRCRGRS